MTHPGVWKHSSWDLLFGRCLLRVKPARSFSLTCVHTLYHTETWYKTFHGFYRCSYLMVCGSVVDGHEEGTEYCPISTATSTCYWQGDRFQDGSKNSRSVKSAPVWGLHQNPISPSDTVTHPRKPEYLHSANHGHKSLKSCDKRNDCILVLLHKRIVAKCFLVYLFVRFVCISYGWFIAICYKFKLSMYVQTLLVVGSRGCVRGEI